MKLRTGKAGENVLDRSVRKRLGKTYKQIPDMTGIGTISLETRDAGLLAVTAAVNSLAAKGICPDTLQTSVLLPSDSEEEDLRGIEDTIAEAASGFDVVVTGGHTEVTSAVTRPVITAAVTGTKRLSAAALCPAKAGQDIVMTKWTALRGTYLIAARKERELMHRFPVSILETCKEMRTLLGTVTDSRVCLEAKGCSYITDVSEGGVYAALWKLARETGYGLTVSLPCIPIRQETIELCNFYDINPYELDAAGSVIAVCDDGAQLVDHLGDAGIHGAVIGHLTAGNDKNIVNADECSSLNLPQPDAILGILG